MATRPVRSAGLSTSLANSVLWDVILQAGAQIPAAEGLTYPVVRFKGHYYLVAYGNPWPDRNTHCKLLARPDNPTGDLCVTSDGLVSKWLHRPGQRWHRRPTIVGVNDEIEPVTTLVVRP